MRGLMLAGVGSGLVAILAGCGWNADAQTAPPRADGTAAASVVVVNLQDVLERLGHDKDLNKQLQAKKEEQQQQFATLSADVKSQVAAKKAELGENATEQQKKELQSLELRLTLGLRQAQAQLNNEFNAYRLQLVNRFREQVKPVASTIAKKRKASVVLARDEGVVLVYENSVDITDDVVQGMLASPTAATPQGDEPPAEDAGP
jgi:Skp family chaperone for outer membrane proteins